MTQCHPGGGILVICIGVAWGPGGQCLPLGGRLLKVMSYLMSAHGRLQMLRHDMPTLFQGVHSMRCFVWQDNMVLMSRFVLDAMRMVRAARSGDELDV